MEESCEALKLIGQDEGIVGSFPKSCDGPRQCNTPKEIDLSIPRLSDSPSSDDSSGHPYFGTHDDTDTDSEPRLRAVKVKGLFSVVEISNRWSVVGSRAAFSSFPTTVNRLPYDRYPAEHCH